MKYDYLIVHKEMLPDYFEKVIDANELLKEGKANNISDAVRQVGISRSTYYKYKDYVYATENTQDAGKKAVFSLVLSHQKGVLSKVLSMLYTFEANVLTIMQNPPIGERAIVVLSIDISGVLINATEMIAELGQVPGVLKVVLLDIE